MVTKRRNIRWADKIFKSKKWAKRWSGGGPIKKVKGGWKIRHKIYVGPSLHRPIQMPIHKPIRKVVRLGKPIHLHKK